MLVLTPLLGVTASLGPAVLYGLAATVLLVVTVTLVQTSAGRWQEPVLLGSVLGLSVALVTALDFAVSLWLPAVRSAWGLYLHLLAFSPLLVVLPLERPRRNDLAFELSLGAKTGLLFTGLLSITAVVREALGRGTLSLVPGSMSWDLPILKEYHLTILGTAGGAFFLAAAGVVAYRALGPWLAEHPDLRAFLEPAAGAVSSGSKSAAVPSQPKNERRVPAPAAKKPVAAAPAPPPKPAAKPSAPPPPLESAEDWGETLAGAVASLPSSGSHEKQRLLVIGSGNGELVYYLAMLCLDLARVERGFSFRVRGVDHFATRVETAVRGVYRDHQIEFIPAPVRNAWMVRGQGDDRYLWKVADEPRLHVQFEVADFHHGNPFFPQPSHLTLLNQGIEYVTDDKKAQLLATVCQHLMPGGALIIPGPFKRELLPEGMKRTGTTVFRKA